VIAIVSAYNEADIISPVIGHLVENGVDVYLIDNWSTDATAAEAGRWLGRGLIKIEKFPETLPPDGQPLLFDWTAILRRKEELAQELDADWFLHHDADEIREPPWPGMNLRDSIAWVDRLGYNCIGFRVFNFPPVDDGFVPGSDPREHFSYWKEAEEFDRSQLKCWKGGRPVSLVPSGGHEAAFPNRNVFPIPFLIRHYPIRGQEQGRRKVFEERKARFLDRERSREWHIQYDAISNPAHSFVADPADLRRFDLDQARLELMLANEITRYGEHQTDQLRSSLEARENEFRELHSEKEILESAGNALRAERTALELDLSASRQQARELNERLVEFDRRLETALLKIAELERSLGREEGRAGELEVQVQGRIGELDSLAADLRRHLEAAERPTGWFSKLRRVFESRGRGDPR
jgi:hypothetical protein